MTTTISVSLVIDPQVSTWLNNGIQINADNVSISVTDLDDIRQVQQAARTLASMGASAANLKGEHWNERLQWAFSQGFSSTANVKAVEFTGSSQTVASLNNKAEIFAWAKDLVHQTPAQLYPETLIQQVCDYLTAIAPEHINVNIISGEALVEAGWTGIYNVGKGSVHAPAMLVLDFNPTEDESAETEYALVGKGITFDSGGYSLKSNEGMVSMKADMAGSAVVAGALALAIKQGLSKRTKLILCCAENMISGHAYKLGDVLTYKNGVTVEILNTDAEGRLVLADGLLAAEEFKANTTINAATLTGAAVMALGGDYSALFALDQTMITKAQNAAAKVDDPVWPLPLEPWHQHKCPSPFAATANSRAVKGGGPGGASNAAGFLSRFAPNSGKSWLHIDLAADYNGSANSLWAAGATGSGIALISQMLMDN